MKNSYEGLDDYVVKTILIKANQLIGKAGYKRDDYDDIIQEIILDVCGRLPKYDPEKSKFETFVNICLRMTTCILKPIRDVQYLPTIADLDAFHISCCCAIFAYGMITCLDIACRAYSFVE